MTKKEALSRFENDLEILKMSSLQYQTNGHKSNQMLMYETAIKCIEESIERTDKTNGKEERCENA